jgi:hypothetical protein
VPILGHSLTTVASSSRVAILQIRRSALKENQTLPIREPKQAFYFAETVSESMQIGLRSSRTRFLVRVNVPAIFRLEDIGASIDTIVIKETVASIEASHFRTREEEPLLTYRKNR